MKQFKGEVALITGASSGIGKATAVAFAQIGIRTVLSDVSVEAGEKAAAEIVKRFDTPAIFVKCDVAKADEVKKLIKRVINLIDGGWVAQ